MYQSMVLFKVVGAKKKLRISVGGAVDVPVGADVGESQLSMYLPL